MRKLKVKQAFSIPEGPLDNAVAESFFPCMKREELSHNYYDTIKELQRDVDTQPIQTHPFNTMNRL